MLKWCSYCQRFTGEAPEYGDFSITHGLCADCEAKHYWSLEGRELAHAQFLRDIFGRLFIAGRNNNVQAAKAVIDEAIGASCRPVDILIGMIAPMLYQIGEDWKTGALSVEGEHRFTAFCKEVIELITARMSALGQAPRASPSGQFLLMNAPGNAHTLAIRILALWLGSRGGHAEIVDGPIDFAGLHKRLVATKPRYLLISMALPEQHEAVADIARRVAALPASGRPHVIVGGYAVKTGLVPAVDGADLVTDISSLDCR